MSTNVLTYKSGWDNFLDRNRFELWPVYKKKKAEFSLKDWAFATENEIMRIAGAVAPAMTTYCDGTREFLAKPVWHARQIIEIPASWLLPVNKKGHAAWGTSDTWAFILSEEGFQRHRERLVAGFIDETRAPSYMSFDAFEIVIKSMITRWKQVVSCRTVKMSRCKQVETGAMV